MPQQKAMGTVLVVDDDEGVRRVIARWALDLGHQVRTATLADEAMAILQQDHIDVLVSDVRMPGHDGVWLVDQVGRNMPHVAIVLATGLTEMDPSVTLRPWVVGYIVKPFNRHDLDEMIQRGLAQSRQQAQTYRRAALPAATGPHLASDRPVPQRQALASENVIDGVVVARY